MSPESVEREAGEAPGAGAGYGQDAALRARLRRILVGIALLCAVLGAAGFAFVRWMATLPPGTLKAP